MNIYDVLAQILLTETLKASKESTISVLALDLYDECVLEAMKSRAEEIGVKEFFVENVQFGDPVSYFSENELNVKKAARLFGGALSFGMDYEYATDLDGGFMKGVSVVNSIFCGRRRWASMVLPGPHKVEYSGESVEDVCNMMLNAILIDPKKLKEKHKGLTTSLTKGKTVEIKSGDTDLKFSIKGKKAISCFGRFNIPDGEVFIAPEEGTVEGHIHFDRLDWGLLNDVTLKFEEGCVVESKASNDDETEMLKKKLSFDEGASLVGEFGIGTNEDVSFMVGDPLFDEKMYGSFHLGIGSGYGSKNKSQRHWDVVKDSRKDVVILLDGEKIFEKGNILV